MVISPLSVGGFGKQLPASNASTSATVAGTETLWDVVFLMRAVEPPHLSGQSEKLLPLGIGYRGWHVYTTELGLVGIDQWKSVESLTAFCSSIHAMFRSLGRRAITLLLAKSLLLPIVFGQQQTPEITRPRRTQPVWTPPSATTPIITTPNLTTVTGAEPTIRVALTPDARWAVISTPGPLMNAGGGGKTLLALDTSRVRVDPRLLSPLPANEDGGFRVTVGGAATRHEAEENEKEIQKITEKDAHAVYDTETDRKSTRLNSS